MFDEQEIHRLLRLKGIKFYELTPSEQAYLDAWKASQVELEMPKKAKKIHKNKVQKNIGKINES